MALSDNTPVGIDLMRGEDAADLFNHVTSVQHIETLRYEHTFNPEANSEVEMFVFAALGDGGIILADGEYERTPAGLEGSTHFTYLSTAELDQLRDATIEHGTGVSY